MLEAGVGDERRLDLQDQEPMHSGEVNEARVGDAGAADPQGRQFTQAGEMAGLLWHFFERDGASLA